MQFDLTDLRLFRHVAEAGSITAGAERAGLALASASARIRGMEDALGVPLLQRGHRGVRTTPAGRALLHHAVLVTGQIAHMRSDLQSYARGLKGHVRLLANTSAVAEFLPKPLASFLAAHPDIDIDLEERPSRAIVEAVAAGLTDIGIVADTVDLGDLTLRPFARDRLVLAAARDHPILEGRRSVAFRDVLGLPFVGLDMRSALQAHVARHAANAGRTLDLRVRLAGFDAICRMVEAGVGVAIVPRTAAVRCRRAMAIRSIGLTDAWTSRQLLLCTRRPEDLPRHARDLVDHLAAADEAPNA